jgi:hypothetical protein
MAEDDQGKAITEGIQAIIKAKQEGFQDCFQSIQKNSETRSQMASAHSENIRSTGSTDEQAEKSRFSKEAQSMM